ncbi:MAG: MurR/RpiR family transcriptional regulator [Anaerolineae bacterium]|nr:MurR/RpiR family transcriptional regulator [Anaerolineae bacterium]
MFRIRMQDAYDSLSPRGKKLASFILENTVDVGFMTATELAKKVSVDPATVVRFSQELRYTGYRELSREIKKYVNDLITQRNATGLLEQNGNESRVAQILDDINDRLSDIKVDTDLIIKVAKTLREAQKIYITGTQVGLGMASVWGNYLSYAGLSVFPFELNTPQGAMLLKDAAEGDVLVGIVLGMDSSIEMSRLFHLANGRGLTTMSITANPSLSIVRESALRLTCNARTPLNVPSFDTVAILLSVIWQMIILYDRKSASESFGHILDGIDVIVRESKKPTRGEAHVIRRMWQNNG